MRTPRHTTLKRQRNLFICDVVVPTPHCFTERQEKSSMCLQLVNNFLHSCMMMYTDVLHQSFFKIKYTELSVGQHSNYCYYCTSEWCVGGHGWVGRCIRLCVAKECYSATAALYSHKPGKVSSSTHPLRLVCSLTLKYTHIYSYTCCH